MWPGDKPLLPEATQYLSTAESIVRLESAASSSTKDVPGSGEHLFTLCTIKSRDLFTAKVEYLTVRDRNFQRIAISF
jgi:hypothetical protein